MILPRRTKSVAAFLVTAGLAMLASLPARADTWVGDSLELMVADADLVVRATIETSAVIPGTADQKATLQVTEVLKGKAGNSIDCVIPLGEDRQIPGWKQNKTELLICLVKPERAPRLRPQTEKPSPWAVRDAWGGTTSIIPLDGEPAERAPTLDFVFLKKKEEILAAATKAIEADAATKVAREKDGSAPKLLIGVPSGTTMDKELHNTISSNEIYAPLNGPTETKAREWAKSPDFFQRWNAVAILSHFKSDQNIALLESLLKDPEAIWRGKGEQTIVQYPLRAAALKALETWGVKATAVVSETQPAQK